MSKYDYYFDHWEVKHIVKLYDDGKPMLIYIDKFETEEEAVAFAKERYAAGETVTVRVVQFLEGWR